MFMDPYLIARKLSQNKEVYSHLVDLWSLGITFYTLLCNCQPFDSRDDADFVEMIRYPSHTRAVLGPDEELARTRVCLLNIRPKTHGKFTHYLACQTFTFSFSECTYIHFSGKKETDIVGYTITRCGTDTAGVYGYSSKSFDTSLFTQF